MDNQSLRYNTGDSSVIKHPIKIFSKVHSYPEVLKLPKASKHYWGKKGGCSERLVSFNMAIKKLCTGSILRGTHM